MNKILKQVVKFLLISGTGWFIDVSMYSILTLLLGISIFFSNTISSILAITFVFYISTKKIFIQYKEGVTLKIKYIIYFIYQLVLVILVSIIAQKLYFIVGNYYLIEADQLKIIIKIFVTPFTMILNFFVLKILSEKL